MCAHFDSSFLLFLGSQDASERPSSGTNYDSEYLAWLTQNYPGRFQTFDEFDHAKKLKKKMSNQGIYQSFCHYMNAHAIFSCEALGNKTCYHLFHALFEFCARHDATNLFLHLCKFCVPSNDGPPWLFRARKDLSKTKCLTVEMKESNVFSTNKQVREANLLNKKSQSQQIIRKQRATRTTLSQEQHLAMESGGVNRRLAPKPSPKKRPPWMRASLIYATMEKRCSFSTMYSTRLSSR